jgi:hypothetical protein
MFSRSRDGLAGLSPPLATVPVGCWLDNTVRGIPTSLLNVFEEAIDDRS